jgi:hypothetical protein
MAEVTSPRPWLSIQIDPLNPNTHYLEDVVVQLERSLKLTSENSSTSSPAVQVGTGIAAEKVEISDVHIAYQESDRALVIRSQENLDRVADAIEERLGSERIALLILNSHEYDRRALSRFRGRLWDDRLEPMTKDGLLLIDIFDPTGDSRSDWPPDPDVILDLPDRFDDGSRPDAQADLAKLALAEKLVSNEGEASVFAKTLLQTSETVVELYANLARIRASSDGLQ